MDAATDRIEKHPHHEAIRGLMNEMLSDEAHAAAVFAALGWYSEGLPKQMSVPPTMVWDTMIVMTLAATFYLEYKGSTKKLADVVQEHWPSAHPMMFENIEGLPALRTIYMKKEATGER